MPVGTEHLIVEKDGPVVTVTMNRPERRNALSPEMLIGMHDAWLMIDEDPDGLICQESLERELITYAARPLKRLA